MRREFAAGTGNWHHGIFCGSNRIIEFGPDNIRPTGTSAATFFENDLSFARVVYASDNGQEGALTAERFERGIGIIARYRLLDNNCEVFASKCKTGKGCTEQIDKMLDAAAHAIRVVRTAKTTKL